MKVIIDMWIAKQGKYQKEIRRLLTIKGDYMNCDSIFSRLGIRIDTDFDKILEDENLDEEESVKYDEDRMIVEEIDSIHPSTIIEQAQFTPLPSNNSRNTVFQLPLKGTTNFGSRSMVIPN